MAKTAFHAIHGVLGFVVAVGQRGRILHFSTDVYHCKEMPSPTTADLHGVYVADAHCAWAVGDEGTVLRWDGMAWQRMLMASRRHELRAIWGCPSDGIWIGGRRTLIRWCRDGSSGNILHAGATVSAIWGSGPADLWFLASDKMVFHWNGHKSESYELPGDEDAEYYAIGGSASDEPVWLVGVSGLIVSGDGEGWTERGAGTEATLSGVPALGPEDVWVTTDAGQLRHWNGHRWTVAAFSAFGWLAGLCHVDGVIWAVGAGGVVLQHRPDDDSNKE